MGDFVMPKHTGLLREFIAPLKVCYEKRNENEGWLPNGNATRKEDGFTNLVFLEYKELGFETEPKVDNSDYTKDAQIPLYLGFMEGRGRNNAEKRITPQGIKMYEAIEAEDVDGQYNLLIDAFERMTFGRNNQGFPSADSDVEVPNVLLLASIILNGVTRQEFYYVIFLMHTKGWDLARAVAEVIYFRNKGKNITEIPTIYTDCKLIPLFVAIKFLTEDEQKRLHIAENVYKAFSERILRLKTKNKESFNSELNQLSGECSDEELRIRQQIYYGAPGTGKSHKIKEQLESVSKENIFRTTFHPDSDYSSFVGCYKPSMEKNNERLYNKEELINKLTELKEQGATYVPQKFGAKYWCSLKQLTVQDKKDILAACEMSDNYTVEFEKGIAIGEEYLKSSNESRIIYRYTPQVFLKAYMRAYRTTENVYLIIEEINRGNCAQIFGDLFQLLDRDANGKSEYTIKADDDLKAFLEEELGKYSEAIKDGELCLPSNLYIWATMNTSDQSLFPIDSAFKRRWDWEYEPIKYKNTDWVICINDVKYSWISFQREVNKRILAANSSEDKMLGDYFVNPHDGIITEKILLNKILFYLWNDVCKEGEGEIFKISETEDVSFSDLHGDGGSEKLVAMLEFLKIQKVE